MEFDFKAILDTMMMAQIEKDDPEHARLIKVFTKKGITVVDAIAMLMEIATIAQEIQENESGN